MHAFNRLSQQARKLYDFPQLACEVCLALVSCHYVTMIQRLRAVLRSPCVPGCFSTRDGIDFNLAYNPDELDTTRSDEFDNRIMNVLFNTGLDLGRTGYRWYKVPPGYAAVKLEETGTLLPQQKIDERDAP